jgi:4-amino-4-deoxy-L-arabinose transferase-like glycosyltransferase
MSGRAWHLLKKQSFAKPLAVCVGIFALALIVRLPELGQSLTIDEHRWLDRSRHFAGGLLFADYECPPVLWGRSFAGTGWACTLQIGYPGVTTMWGGAIGLVAYYWLGSNASPTDLHTFLDTLRVAPVGRAVIAPMRWPLVVLAALFVAFFYWLTKLLLGERVALVSSLLLALDPFHVAHSRVLHNDALTTTFMVLSLLAIAGYWLQGRGRRWLLFSAAMAGLAFLTKPISWFLIPYTGLLGGLSLYHRWRSGSWRGWHDVRRLIGEGIVWGAVAGLVFVALFPAMWVIPKEVIRTMFGIVQLTEEAQNEYFLGQATPDPGPLFYPIGWLLRVSPLAVLGLLALPFAGWRSARRQLDPLYQERPHRPTLVALVLFIGLFLLFVTVSGKKTVRYFLPAFPLIDIFAALGLLWLSRYLELAATKLWKRKRFSRRGPVNSESATTSQATYRVVYSSLIAGILLVQASLALWHTPYYFTYYNPLLGGGRVAQRLISVGRGEGLDLAAAYLNQKPNADQLKVSSWYEQVFGAYFVGQTNPFFSIGDAMASDYLVFYQNQLQRQLPDPDLLSYYQKHYTPEYIVHLKGIDYALIYPVPLERRTNWETTNIFGKLILYGYRQEKAEPGTFSLRLVWENQGMSGQDSLQMALQGCQATAYPFCSQPVSWQPCTLASGFEPDAQRVGALVESTCQLDTADLMPGIYSLHVGVGPSVEGDVVDLLAPSGELGISVPQAGVPRLISPDYALDALVSEALPSGAQPLHVSYGNAVAMVGYQITPPSSPGDRTATVTLYWQALQDIPQPTNMAGEFQVRFDLVAPDDSQISPMTDHLSGLSTLGDMWKSGQVLADGHHISVPEDLSPGNYYLVVGLVRADSGELVPALDMANGWPTGDEIQLDTAIRVLPSTSSAPQEGDLP